MLRKCLGLGRSNNDVLAISSFMQNGDLSDLFIMGGINAWTFIEVGPIDIAVKLLRETIEESLLGRKGSGPDKMAYHHKNGSQNFENLYDPTVSSLTWLNVLIVGIHSGNWLPRA